MEKFKTVCFMADDLSGELWQLDTIWHEGHWWLVPSWLQPPDGRDAFPEWLVRPLSGLQEDPEPKGRVRFALSTPLPKLVLEGQAAAGFDVRSGLPLERSQESGAPSIH